MRTLITIPSLVLSVTRLLLLQDSSFFVCAEVDVNTEAAIGTEHNARVNSNTEYYYDTDFLTELSSALSRDIDGDGRLSAKYLCEAESNCGGIIFKPSSSDSGEKEVECSKLFVVPLRYENVKNDDNDDNIFISTKPWLIQRGAVNIPAYALSSTVIRTDEDITIEEARKWCKVNKECIAFTFPLKSQRSLTKVDQVIYVNRIAEFDYGPEHYMDKKFKRNDYEREEEEGGGDEDEDENATSLNEWITHIIHDRQRLMGKIPKYIDLNRSKWEKDSRTPYRPCCSSSEMLPNIEELKEADTLERIDCSISREEFFERYEKPRKAVMLVGCTEGWRAKELWSSFDTIQTRFANESLWEFQSIRHDHETGDLVPSGENDPESRITWEKFQQFYAKLKEDPTFGAIRMFRKLHVGEYVTDELRKDYTPPKVFDGANLYEKTPKYKEHWFPKNFGLMGYFIMGSYGTGTGPHADPLTTDAWSTLVSGHKWWLVYPKLPGVIDQPETQCSMTCSDSESSFHGTGSAETMAWYASVAKHANKFYYGNGQHARHVLQRPGETIYLPHGMLHSVMNMEETIAITEKFASFANLEEVWREILTSGEDYDWPHLYYKVFNQEQREIVRNVVWPITNESIAQVTDNTVLYTREESSRSWKYDDEDEEDFLDEEEDFTRLSLEEYDNLAIDEKHIYLDRLSWHLDFDPQLKRPSEYRRMTEQEKEYYHKELRWMASPEFETHLKNEGLDDSGNEWEEEDFNEDDGEEEEDPTIESLTE